MGRPKVVVMDDSAPVKEEKKKKSPKEKLSRTDKPEMAKSELVKTSNEVETIETEARGDGEEVSSGVAAASETSEDAPEETEPAGPRATKKKPQKPGKAKPRSKKYQELTKDLDRSKIYPLSEAVDMIKKLSYTKFNATLEAHLNTAQTGIRGLVSLPYASGKQLRILAFGPSKTPTKEGVIFGSDETIDTIGKGKVDFDLLVTTPEWMPKLAKIARILGPRGLMPNPKNGTIADDLNKAIEGFQAGKTEYKTEAKAPVIHIALGKINQPTEELIANIKMLVQTVGKTRVKKISLSPTMGPSVKVDLTSF